MLSDLQVWSHCLSLTGVSHDISVDDLSTILRKIYVTELLGERRSQYEGLITHTNFDYEAEANKFSISEFFDSELGNTMPLAIATALQFPNNNISKTTQCVSYVCYSGYCHYTSNCIYTYWSRALRCCSSLPHIFETEFKHRSLYMQMWC